MAANARRRTAVSGCVSADLINWLLSVVGTRTRRFFTLSGLTVPFSSACAIDS